MCDLSGTDRRRKIPIVSDSQSYYQGTWELRPALARGEKQVVLASDSPPPLKQRVNNNWTPAILCTYLRRILLCQASRKQPLFPHICSAAVVIFARGEGVIFFAREPTHFAFPCNWRVFTFPPNKQKQVSAPVSPSLLRHFPLRRRRPTTHFAQKKIN